MRLFIVLIFTSILCELTMQCRKGEKVSSVGGCEPCREGTFQSEENTSKQCNACRRCDDDSGSEFAETCTSVSNAKCTCRSGFVKLDDDFSTCECPAGFGLNKDTKECTECKKGYFSTSVNSPCRKWKECKLGVKKSGTTTKDAICNDQLQTYITTSPTPNKITSLITSLKTPHPHEGAQTPEIHTSKTTTPPRPHSTPKNTGQPSYPPNTANQIGLAVLIFGIVGLLVLTAVTCKLHITPYMARKPAVPKNESVCRRPVEEIGDSMSSLKQNPEEP